MITRDELAQLLRRANVVDVAREAQVSTKTVYRLRHKQHAPTLATLERLLSAVKRIEAEREAA